VGSGSRLSNSVLESFPYNFPVGTAENERGQSLNRYEVARPLFCNLKGGYHISCPFGYVGRGRVRVVTHGLNLPRHGTEAACRICGFYSVRDAGQNRRRSVKGSRRNNFTCRADFHGPGRAGRQAHRVRIRCIFSDRIRLSFQAVECKALWLDKQRYMRRSVCILF